jgi:hypothetical protein
VCDRFTERQGIGPGEETTMARIRGSGLVLALALIGVSSLPTEVKASTVEGTTGDDVILYGEVYHWAYSGGHWWVAHSPGICVFSPGGGGDCDISTAIKHEEWTDSTYGLYGDASGGYGEDYIYPADMCTTGTINCNGGYWIGMADVSSSARFYLRGDRTSTTSGADD